MLRLAESAGTLTLYTPTWFGVAAIILGVVVIAFAAWRRLRITYIVGAVVIALALGHYGWKSIQSTVTLHPAGIAVESPFGDERRIGWSQVARHEIEDRTSSRYLVFVMRNGDWFELRVSDLTPEEGKRVLEFVRAHSKG